MIIKKVPVVFKTPVIETDPESVQSCPHYYRPVVSPPVCLILPSIFRFDLTNGPSSKHNLLKWSTITEFQRKVAEMVHEATNNICYTYLVFFRQIFSYTGISVFVSVRKLAVVKIWRIWNHIVLHKAIRFPTDTKFSVCMSVSPTAHGATKVLRIYEFSF